MPQITQVLDQDELGQTSVNLSCTIITKLQKADLQQALCSPFTPPAEQQALA